MNPITFSSRGLTSALPYVLAMLALTFAAACERTPAETQSGGHEPVVEDLIVLLKSRGELEQALQSAIEKAALKDIESLDDFYRHLDTVLTTVPTERELAPGIVKIHFVVGQAPEDRLNEDAAFSKWLSDLAKAWGAFMDTPASVGEIETFLADPDYKVDDYVVAPSGWLTFNQFFAREVKPGRRPIADPRDDSVIVSPADAVFKGAWPIEDDSSLVVKGVNWPIGQLLDGSPYKDEFRNGIYTHSFLYVDDYHRFHTPVAGEVKELRNVHGRVYLDVIRGEDGELEVVDGESYQFNQERGLVVIDSPELGLVAMLPVGMSFISSVRLTAEAGAQLRKGDQLGFFQCGGSDVVLLFQDREIEFEAEAGTKYLQGERIAALR